MVQSNMFQNFFKGLDQKAQAELSYYFQKQMMLEEFRKGKEMQKIKEEITNDVMNRISVNILNTVRQKLDKLF